MKKKSFLGGIGAKLALAVVALSSVLFTSCESEEFKISPVEFPNASATIAVSVYDLSNGEILQQSSIAITAGPDGTIAAKTQTIPAPTIEGYLPGKEITVSIPALAKGQYALIPAMIYLQSELGAAKNPAVSEVPGTTPSTSEEALTPSSYTNETDKAVEKELQFNVSIGQEVTNLKEVLSEIDMMVPVGRAYTNSEVNRVLKALVNSYSPGITSVSKTAKFTIPAYSSLTLSPKTTLVTTVNNIETTIDGKVYTIKDVEITKAGNTVVTPSTESIGHDHGHGTNGNAGGGGAGK